jgi:hypothetical protein
MDHQHQQPVAPVRFPLVDQHAVANASGSSCATAVQQEPQAARAVGQQTRGCSQQQLLKLELLQILVAMRTANQSSSVRALS